MGGHCQNRWGRQPGFECVKSNQTFLGRLNGNIPPQHFGERFDDRAKARTKRTVIVTNANESTQFGYVLRKKARLRLWQLFKVYLHAATWHNVTQKIKLALKQHYSYLPGFNLRFAWRNRCKTSSIWRTWSSHGRLMTMQSSMNTRQHK